MSGLNGKVADLDHLFQTVLQEKGKLDVLVANPGRVQPEEFGKITEDDFDKMFDLNTRAALFTAQKALPLMRDGGSTRPGRLDRRLQGHERLHHLQRNQGGIALLRPHLDAGVQGPRHPDQHPDAGQSRSPEVAHPGCDDDRRAAHLPCGRCGTSPSSPITGTSAAQPAPSTSPSRR